MKKKNLWIISVLISGLFIFGCSPRAKYERKLNRELSGGERYDSLFMGIYLGMTDKEFYTHCWKLNKEEGLIKQGPNNTTVEYQTKDELKHPATLNFYPGFHNSKIFEMPVKFVYNGWAPWNKRLSADSLQIDVLNWYKEIYGPDFFRIKHKEHGIAYVKIDGNRRISIFKKDEMTVFAVFTDMMVKKELNDSIPKAGKIYDENTKEHEE